MLGDPIQLYGDNGANWVALGNRQSQVTAGRPSLFRASLPRDTKGLGDSRAPEALFPRGLCPRGEHDAES